MSDLETRVNSMLNEEQWTRASLSSFTINNFSEFDELLEEIYGSELEQEVRELCQEQLEKNKNSIVALYISGLLTLKHQQLDDSGMIHLINIFVDNHKWNIVEFLCTKVLEYGENKYALRTLEEFYSNEGMEEKKFDVWERLIKVDYDEAPIVRQLAEKREEEGDREGAVDYYKKAIHRFIGKGQFSVVKDIWAKIVELGEQEYEFLFLIENRVSRVMDGEKAVQLLEDLYPSTFEKGEWDVSIEILKKILAYDPKNNLARNQIVECYRNKYQDHSQLDEYIRLSNLNQGWRNVIEAISDFEKHISFDSGSFVYHKTWGVGLIKSIKDDDIVIDFTKKRAHTMSLKMAVNALQSLTKEHIWVLKSIFPKDKLKAKIKKDHIWALKIIIKSFDNSADIKKIKSELVPAILTPGEWTGWSSNAREILKTDSAFGNDPDKMDHYVVRDKPMSLEERIYNSFRTEKNFFKRVNYMREFLEDCDPNSDYFNEIFQFFVGYLKTANVNYNVVCSYLLVTKTARKYPFLNPGLNWGFKELFSDIDEEKVVPLFLEIDDADLRREFLMRTRQEVEDWDRIYHSVFPFYQTKYIIEDLLGAGFKERVDKLFTDVVERYREYREAFLWVARTYAENEKWQVKSNIKYEKVLINLIHLLDLTYRDIANKKDATTNRKISRGIETYLFKEQRLENYIMEGDKDTVYRLFSLLHDVKDANPKMILDLQKKIEEKFPDFKIAAARDTRPIEAQAKSRNFFVTEAALMEKQKELKNIIEVEIPKNSKEIGKAIELGDLKENAEYKAGKEKQESLQIAVGRLQDEIERARVFNPEETDIKKVSFGTKVVLLNNDTEKEETFTIMGPWESDPSNQIISYISPFGAELFGHKKNKKLKFVINEQNYSYQIMSIEKAEI
ncbi:MAG: transcription elongation factor GreA [Spirochaetales bacterium]|nr:transcription elongation factor GreA [Spirochaetales bacterium]